MISALRTVACAAVAAAFVAGSAGAIRAQDASQAAPQPMIGTAAPGFDLESTTGTRLSLADLKGKFVVMHFGASW